MAVSVLHQFFDINTLLTLSMEPDGDAITGNYHRMVGLALKDPEGCVRSMPASDMDADKFSEYFHCSSSIVARTIETLQKFGLITIEDGKIFITLLRKDKMKKAAAQQKAEKTAEQRAKGAARTAAWRARKTTADCSTSSSNHAEPVAENGNEPSTDRGAEPATKKCSKGATNKRNKAVTETGNEAAMKNPAEPVTAPVGETGSETVEKPLKKPAKKRAATAVAKRKAKSGDASRDAVCDKPSGTQADYNYNNYNCNNLVIKNSDNCNSNYAHAKTGEVPVTDKGSPHAPDSLRTEPPSSADETDGSCLPFSPGDYVDESKLILLDKLAAPAQNVLRAWNRLNLKTFKGLYSSLAEKLYDILYRFGEETFLKVIENVKNSPFLMGRTHTRNNWRATFTWLLKEENFINVRDGKYNRDPGGGFDSEAEPQAFTRCLPGSEHLANLSPEERQQRFREFLHPHNPGLDEMARDFGVTY